MLRLHNTETRTKEPITASDGKRVRLYTCGPTVYHYAHIGNLRTYVFEDLLRRTIHYFGMPVLHIMNITDVDDKTITGAREKGVPLSTFTETFREAFIRDLHTLNILPADTLANATDHIDDMIEMIQILLDKGIAYKAKDGSIFYRINAFPSYGRLSHLHIDELQAGASERVDTDEYDKENLSDFVLWKAYDKARDGDVVWESPFGRGRPGWHIECSAMATKLLGPSIDLHCGGVDNIFPHHDNEIAQSEACFGCCFARHWAHAEHLIVDGRKMSKSLGNFYQLSDLLDKGYTGVEVRYLLLSVHYRTQLNFTLKGLDAARHSIQRLSDFIHRLRTIKTDTDRGYVPALLDKTKKAFDDALADDLNISVALAALFDLVREGNTLIDRKDISAKEAALVLDFLTDINQVVAVIPLAEQELVIPLEVQEAFDKRNAARQVKNWAEADAQRDFIHSQGFLIEDTSDGPQLKINS